MSFDLSRILASKKAFRQQQAALPIEEKLRMLDQLRERTLALRENTEWSPLSLLREELPPHFRIDTPS